MIRTRFLAAGLLLALSLPLGATAGTLSIVPSPRWVHVAHIYDGDTFRTDDGTRVRLLGINAPEVAHGDQPGQPLGPEAGRRLAALIGGKEVRLVTDTVHHDVYGRLLAQVYRRDGMWIDGELVREGLAHVYIFPPNFLHAAELLRDEDAARTKRLGIWGTARFRVLAVTEVERGLAGQFRVVEGRVDHLSRNGLGFRMGRLHVSIPRAYRRYFPARLDLATGARVRVRGVLRISQGGRIYLALHSPYDLSKILSP